MDTRPWRLELDAPSIPTPLHWIDVDTPEIIDLKRALLQKVRAANSWLCSLLDLSKNGAAEQAVLEISVTDVPEL
jgi:O-methyltransferase involved in polyketide biosynthesis